MASPLGNRKNAKFMAVSTAPSINKTPMGNSTPPVPYPVCQDLSNSAGIVSHVKLNGDPAYVLDQTTQSRCTGDEPGTAKGIKSGTVSGEVKPTSASGHVKITKKRVVRVGDTCTLNAGNCPGVYVAAPAPAAPGASANPPIVPETPQEKAFLQKLGLWWEETTTELGQAVAHPVEATKGAVKDTLNIVPQLGQLLMHGSALQSAGQIEQAAALQSAFGNSQTASQLHTTAEGVRQGADQLQLPQFEMSNPAQEGGAKIAMAAQLATGVAGLAKGATKLGARGMAKLGAREAGALEKAAGKVGKTGDGFHVKGRGPEITGKAVERAEFATRSEVSQGPASTIREAEIRKGMQDGVIQGGPRERAAAVKQWYSQHPQYAGKPDKLDSLAGGTDLSSNVKVKSLQPGTKVEQWVRTDGKPGIHFSPEGTDPSTLGIKVDSITGSPEGRTLQVFEVKKPTQIMETKCSDFLAGNVDRVGGRGGGTQYIMPPGWENGLTRIH